MIAATFWYLSTPESAELLARTRDSDQPGGMAHACELETSLYLAIHPERVQMDKAVREMIDRGSLNVVHLIYRGREWESGAKDFEFSRRTMLDHWAQGGAAVAKVIDAGDRLIAQNILNGKSASFDLQGQGDIKEKQA